MEELYRITGTSDKVGWFQGGGENLLFHLFGGRE